MQQNLINENRGLFWFVEKDKETASSEYVRGDSFGLHKNLSTIRIALAACGLTGASSTFGDLAD